MHVPRRRRPTRATSGGSQRLRTPPSATSRSRTATRCSRRRSRNGAATGANWCTYATWASRQAGRTIRGEDLGDRLGKELRQGAWLRHPIRAFWRRLLRRGLLDPESRIGRLTGGLHTPFDAFELAADAVARGNRKVFDRDRAGVRALPPRVPARRHSATGALRRQPATGGAARRTAPSQPGVHPLPPPRRGEGRAGSHGAGGAGEPRDRAPRADAPPAGDPRGARRAVRDEGGARAPGARPRCSRPPRAGGRSPVARPRPSRAPSPPACNGRRAGWRAR